MLKRLATLGLPTAFQMAWQGISFLTAFYIIRTLSVREFAIYSALLALSQTIVAACDLGTTTSISFYYQRTRANIALFMWYFAGVVETRLVLFSLALLFFYPVFVFTSPLQAHFSSILLALIVSALIALVSASYGTLLTVLRVVEPRGVLKAIAIDTVAGVGRLLLIVLAFSLFSFKTALAALVVSLIIAILQTIASRVIMHANTFAHVSVDRPAPRAEVFRHIAPVIPGSVYYSVQPLLMTWIAAYFGGIQQIAQVGVVGRISVVFSLLSFVASSQMIPALARTTDQTDFGALYIRFLGGLLVVCVAIIALGATFPTQILWLAGGKYAGLETALQISIATAMISIIGGFAVQTLRVKGWNRYEPYCTIFQITIQIALFFNTTYGDINSVVLFGMYSSLLYCAPYLVLNGLGMIRPEIFKVKDLAHER